VNRKKRERLQLSASGMIPFGLGVKNHRGKKSGLQTIEEERAIRRRKKRTAACMSGKRKRGACLKSGVGGERGFNAKKEGKRGMSSCSGKEKLSEEERGAKGGV